MASSADMLKGKKKKEDYCKNKSAQGGFILGFGFELFYRIHKFSKLPRIFNRHLAQNFPVDGDFFIGHFFDKSAVFFSALAKGGVETQNPEASKSSFFCPAVAISVFPGFEKRFFRRAIMRFSAPHKTFGLFQKLFFALSFDYTALHS